MEVATVLNGLTSAVNGATLQGNTLQVAATRTIPDAPDPPAFYPFTWRMVYDRDYGGGGDLTITAHLLLSRGDSETGQQEAQDLAGAGADTLRDAINDARGAPGQPALDGACDDVHLVDASGPRDFTFPNGTHFWGLELTIHAID